MKLKKEERERILIALYRYYLDDITFERAAEEANVPLYVFIKFVEDNKLPIIYTYKDTNQGIKKVFKLLRVK
jgi:predicted HTH domain antitoxin